MAALDSGLSTYKAPSYTIDLFPFYLNGKYSTNYIYATIYNKIASAIIATESRLQAIAPTISNPLPITVSLYFADGTTSIPYARPDGGGGVLPWGNDTVANGYQNGISDAYIDLTSNVSGTGQIAAEFFYGSKTIASWATPRMAYRWYEKRTDAGQGEGPCLVGNWFNGNSWETNNPGYTGNFDKDTNQDLNLSSTGRPLRLGPSALIPTPYRARGNWTGPESSDIAQPKRVIIGACRADAIGTQYRLNREVFNPPPGVTGNTTVPSHHTPEGKTLLGPGALMLTGTFWIIRDEDTNTPQRQKRFHCYPNLNSPHKEGTPPTCNFWAHVLVMGSKN